jgi:hypothetical protein
MRRLGLRPGVPVLVFLRDPKQKAWGLLLSLGPAGVVLRGMDLAIFEDWLRQEARREDRQIGPTTLFYPMWRVERMERDETIGPVAAYADRLIREVGRSARELMRIGRSEGRGRAQRRRTKPRRA